MEDLKKQSGPGEFADTQEPPSEVLSENQLETISGGGDKMPFLNITMEQVMISTTNVTQNSAQTSSKT